MKVLTIDEEVDNIEEALEYLHSDIERLKKGIKPHKTSIGVLETFLQGGCVIKAMQ